MTTRQYAENPELRFVKVLKGTKKPFEKDWVNKPYTWAEIQPHVQTQQNFGVLCGYGGLIVVDADRPELVDAVRGGLPPTFEVMTGSRGFHFYFFCPETKRKILIENSNAHFGEVQAKGTQVIGAGSLHPNGNLYRVVQDVSIAHIGLETLMECINPFLPPKQPEEVRVRRTIRRPLAPGSNITDIRITDIINTSQLKARGSGEYRGKNPWHGAQSGENFSIYTGKNIAVCHHCHAIIDPVKAIALEHKIVNQCNARLTKADFYTVLIIAREQYGLGGGYAIAPEPSQ